MGFDAGMDMGMNAASGVGAAGIVTVLKYVLITLGGGVLLGIVFGLVIAGIKYPNPNKKALFSPVQKIIVIVVAVLGIAITIYAFTKKPGSDVPADAEASMGQMVDENGVPIDTPVLDGEGDDGADSAAADSAATDSAAADSTAADSAAADSTEGDDSDEEASDSSSEAEEISSSSVSSAASSSKAATANANAAAPRITYRKGNRSGMVIMG